MSIKYQVENNEDGGIEARVYRYKVIKIERIKNKKYESYVSKHMNKASALKKVAKLNKKDKENGKN
jgi:hypothetical protein